tara:strand:- start:100 stop:312 length:213 start_codon:yes stop_codon:yes gene_type:complete
MSAEKIVVEEHNLNLLETPEVIEKKLSGRVDINELLARVRDEKKKENMVNIVFFCLFASLILVVGIILSL